VNSALLVSFRPTRREWQQWAQRAKFECRRSLRANAPEPDQEGGAALFHSDVDTPATLKAKRLQASILNPCPDCRRTHPGASRSFMNREQKPVILGSLAVEIDVAGSVLALDADAGQRPLLE
jgi:hypothetical protein